MTVDAPAERVGDLGQLIPIKRLQALGDVGIDVIGCDAAVWARLATAASIDAQRARQPAFAARIALSLRGRPFASPCRASLTGAFCGDQILQIERKPFRQYPEVKYMGAIDDFIRIDLYCCLVGAG